MKKLENILIICTLLIIGNIIALFYSSSTERYFIISNNEKIYKHISYAIINNIDCYIESKNKICEIISNENKNQTFLFIHSEITYNDLFKTTKAESHE